MNINVRNIVLIIMVAVVAMIAGPTKFTKADTGTCTVPPHMKNYLQTIVEKSQHNDVTGDEIKQFMTLACDGNCAIRRMAAYGLGVIGDPRALPILIGKLEDPNDHVRRIAAKAIGKIGEREAESHLLGVLQNDDEPDHVKCSAIEALGRIGGSESIPVLADYAGSSRNWVRHEAIQSLARVTTRIVNGNR